MLRSIGIIVTKFQRFTAAMFLKDFKFSRSFMLDCTGCVKRKVMANFGMSLCGNYWVNERNFCMVIKS